MKLTSPMIAGISTAALLCLVQIYIDIQWVGASGDLGRLKAASASESAQVASLQGSVTAFQGNVKMYDAAIGPRGTIQLLASGLVSGDAELSVKSLKVVSGGKALVTLASNPDAGGVIQVGANDGTGSAEISAGPGRSRIAFKATTTGADAAPTVHLATYAGDGLYLQKGATEDLAARTDGAGLQIKDTGASFFMAQSGGGNVSIDTPSSDERAKLSLWSDGGPKKVSLSLGAADASPYLSAVGAASGYSMTLVPDRLSLVNKDGSVTLTLAGDDNGGFVVANDKTGDRRAIMASGTEGHGSLSVFGSDNRSNTFLPEFDIQKKGTSSQK